jgi:hypothetical protein
MHGARAWGQRRQVACQIVANGHGPATGKEYRAFLLTPVLSPAEEIDQIITTIEYQLPKGIANSFITKLEHARAALEAGDTGTACAELQASINHARAQSGKKLTVEQAAALVAEVEAFRAKLGCS